MEYPAATINYMRKLPIMVTEKLQAPMITTVLKHAYKMHIAVNKDSKGNTPKY